MNLLDSFELSAAFSLRVAQNIVWNLFVQVVFSIAVFVYVVVKGVKLILWIKEVQHGLSPRAAYVLGLLETVVFSANALSWFILVTVGIQQSFFGNPELWFRMFMSGILLFMFFLN